MPTTRKGARGNKKKNSPPRRGKKRAAGDGSDESARAAEAGMKKRVKGDETEGTGYEGDLDSNRGAAVKGKGKGKGGADVVAVEEVKGEGSGGQGGGEEGEVEGVKKEDDGAAASDPKTTPAKDTTEELPIHEQLGHDAFYDDEQPDFPPHTLGRICHSNPYHSSTGHMPHPFYDLQEIVGRGLSRVYAGKPIFHTTHIPKMREIYEKAKAEAEKKEREEREEERRKRGEPNRRERRAAERKEGKGKGKEKEKEGSGESGRSSGVRMSDLLS